MKKPYLILLGTLSVSGLFAQNDLVLWYDSPVQTWNEALPLGNGGLGAMLYGNPSREIIQQLNEETVRSGSPYNNYNPLAKDHLGEMRELIFQRKFKDAEEPAGRYIASQTANGMTYQTVGSLGLEMEGNAVYPDYSRGLDLSTAVASLCYTSNGVKYRREVFASHPDNVIVVRLMADKPGAITLRALFDSPMEVKKSLLDRATLSLDGVGGNCRLRVHTPIAGAGLRRANGKNANAFHALTDIAEPVVSARAPAYNNDLKPTTEYDVKTAAGKSYSFGAK